MDELIFDAVRGICGFVCILGGALFLRAGIDLMRFEYTEHERPEWLADLEFEEQRNRKYSGFIRL